MWSCHSVHCGPPTKSKKLAALLLSPSLPTEITVDTFFSFFSGNMSIAQDQADDDKAKARALCALDAITEVGGGTAAGLSGLGSISLPTDGLRICSLFTLVQSEAFCGRAQGAGTRSRRLKQDHR